MGEKIKNVVIGYAGEMCILRYYEVYRLLSTRVCVAKLCYSP